VINTRLLEAQSPRLRWQAALGLLLAGEAAAWDKRIADRGTGELEMWTALASPEARSPLLLPTYAAAISGSRENRGSSAQHLSRYRQEVNDPSIAAKLREMLRTLAADNDSAVSTQAYLSAGMLQLSGLEGSANAALANTAAPTVQRWAAASYLMRLADAGKLAANKES
jgi:hypothetical protein